MEKPLRSESGQPRRTLKPLVSQSGQAEDTRFRDFGTLNTGKPSGIGPITSIIGNVAAAFIIWVLWKAAPPAVVNKPNDVLTYAEIKPTPPPPPPPVKLPPTPRFKPVIQPTPKVSLPEVKVPEPPKIEVPKLPPTPAPVVTAAAPKKAEAPPAPKVQPVTLAHAASVPNNDTHPAPVALGQPTNPIAVSSRPATAAVNLGQRGMPNMPGGNTGHGPVSNVPNLGSGQPNGTNMAGTHVQPVSGLPRGVPNGQGGGVGNGNVDSPRVVALGEKQPLANTPRTTPPGLSKSKPPQVLFQPKPAYTADATQNHIEGTIRVRIRVSATGQVTVLGMVGGGLGHGLDQSALNAAQALRFRPALDAQGNPTDWEGVVNVLFQIAT